LWGMGQGQNFSIVGWVVLPKACRCLWGGVVEEHYERVVDILWF